MRSFKKRSAKKSRSEITAREAAISAAIDFAQKAQTSAPILFRPATPTTPRPKATPQGRTPTNQRQPANSNPAMRHALTALFASSQAPQDPVEQKPHHIRSSINRKERIKIKGVVAPQTRRKKSEPSNENAGSKAQKLITKQGAKPKSTKKNKKKTTAPTTSRKGVITRKSKEPRQIVYQQSNASARLELNKKLSGRSDTPGGGDISPFHFLHQKWLKAVLYLAKFQASDPTASDVLAKQLELESIEQEWLRRMGLTPADPDYFPWPSTHIDNFSAISSIGGRRETGMLSYLGYRVGMGSPYTSEQRARLLNYIFEGILPPVDSLSYLKEWGPPKSSPRLRRMAETIASFVKDAKRRRATNMVVAIQHWEDDLRYLRKTFYQGQFNFAWPDTRP